MYDSMRLNGKFHRNHGPFPMGFNEFLAGINAKKPKEINLINGIITTT
jgi:hypothetical protein